MPGTTRYSATFDRTYEEDDRVDPSPPPNARRSRSLSLQTYSGLDGGRPYTPLGIRPPSQRSSSTDSGPLKVAEHIPTRTVAKTAVKAHNNPFQFVKVGTCPLYKKAEEQLKKTKEVKKQDVLQEEEEEWQSNLDSWKSRRRKMSEDIFRRQEEIRQFELEEQVAQTSQKKTKTFSEMVESRSTRGRALSLCLISSPLDFQDWEFENKSLKNGSCSTFTDDSEENSTVNSEDEGVILRGRHLHLNSQNNNRTNGDAHIEQNGSKLETHNGDYNKLDLTSNSVQKPKEGSYIDSGLESISSSHRAGDTPDSGSDFSQDSNSSIDCESPRTGINILEEFNSKSLQVPPGQELTVRLALTDKTQEFGFTLQVDKDAGQVHVTSVLKGSTAESSGVQLGDQIITIDGIHVSSKQHTEIISMIDKKQEKGEMVLLLWRHSKTTNGFNTNGDHVKSPAKQNKTESQTVKSESQQYEKSIESENEMYVDDFEELQRQSELLISSNKSETSCIKSEDQSNGNHSPTSISSKTESLKTSSAPKQKENAINGADNEKNSDKTSSELITEIPKKNIIKVKRVRKKGVCGLDVSSTPNQIPQGVPVNYLYPLSPVTELPSPADETKTISSTLSSKPSTPVVKSEKSIFPKEALNEAEVKINSSKTKESASPTTTVPKSATFKNAIPTENQKISSSEKVENKTISSNVPVSPINTKDINFNSLEISQDEKSKAQSSPKKVKVKVKKANTSSDQKSSASSQATKVTPNSSAAQTSNVSIKKLAFEMKTNQQQICDTLKDKQVKVKKSDRIEASQKKENNISSVETVAFSSEDKHLTQSKTAISNGEILSDAVRNLSVEVDALNHSMNLNTASITESNKQPNTPIKENSKSLQTEEKEEMKTKENKAETAPVLPESKSTSKTKASVAKNKNLSLKIDAESRSATLDATSSVEKSILPKTPQDKKANISLASKIEKMKLKEVDAVLTENIATNTKEIKCIGSKNTVTSSNTTTSSDKPRSLSLNISTQSESVNMPSTCVIKSKPPKTPQDEKSKPGFTQKKENAKSKDDSILSSEKSENKPKCDNVKEKSLVSDACLPDKTKELPLKIDAPKESVILSTSPAITNSKQSKSPQDEKAKPRLVRKRSKSKGKDTEETASNKCQSAFEESSASTHVSSNKSTTIENESNKVQTSGSVVKISSLKVSNESKESLQTKVNSSALTEIPVAPTETKSANSEKNIIVSNIALSGDTKNLSLKISTPNELVSLNTSPTSASPSSQPNTPQGEKPKPRLVRKRSKGKGTQPKISDKSPEALEVPIKSLLHTLPASTEDSKSKTGQKYVSKNEDKCVSMEVHESTESSKKRENSIVTSGTTTVMPQKNSDFTEKLVSDSVLSENINLSLKIDVSHEAVTLATTPPLVNNENQETPPGEKPKPRLVRKKSKPKGKVREQITSDPSDVAKETYINSIQCNSSATTKSGTDKEQKFGCGINTSSKKISDRNTESSQIRGSHTDTLKTSAVLPVTKSTCLKENTMVSDSSLSDKTRNLSLNDTSNLSATVTTSPSISSCNKQPKAQDEQMKPLLVRRKSKKGKAAEQKLSSHPLVNKESSDISVPSTPTIETLPSDTVQDNKKSEPVTNNLAAKKFSKKAESETRDSSSRMASVILDSNSAAAKDKISTINAADAAKTKNLTLNIGEQIPCMNIPATCAVANNKQLKSPSKEKSKSFTQKKESAKPKSTISQKVNSPAKQNEEISNSNIDSLNIVFQSEPKNILSDNQFISSNINENSDNKKGEKDFVTDILPVEKVAEEMEKLILEQLEEEERAKELTSEAKNTVGTPEHLLIAPPRLAEPPKEKPPPPPSTNEATPKDPSLKRVNSTKRIKKEIHKRRSNFLGIDNAEESLICNEPSIPPPPALEEILKAEMELDRQSRIKIENAAIERLTLEEKEIMEKEREIIETLESEERMRQMLNGTDGEVICEENHILSLKNERKRIEAEHSLTDEQQQLNLLEEKQLREREEFIRKQEAAKSARPLSDSSLSVAANASNISQPALSFLTDTKSKVSLSSTNGDGNNVSPNPCHGITENSKTECDQKVKASEKPAVPPKPLKKKEAIRKERERLRQEQEALQRDREEHRRKLMLEQEELMKQHKSHAPDASVSRLGPLPPLVPTSFPPQLTTPINATPNARESASFPSRSHHGDPNIAAGSINAVELMGPPVVRQKPPSRKAAQNEAWGQQKMPSVKKQNQDSLTESRYNQNHWLIQEAEMRRIAELKERQQRVTQLPCSQTHLAEDDVCSNPPRVPVITPPHNPHLNYAVQDKMWNYGQPPKKYSPAAVATKDTLHTVYPRETVSQQPPTKPSRVVPMERQEQMLSVSGRKRCSHCNEELGRGAAMIIESLQLYYHIHCFQCCVCQAQLGNGSCGTDVRVRNNKLHCHNCYSNDEAGLKFSQV